ncbi:MAG: ATP-binding protein, partial [Synechococcales cyanobacterium]
DGSKLQQVLINLLTNAIKFTHQGQIVLKVHHQAHQASNTPRLNFQLTDTGVGIAPEDISGLFEPFTQGKAGRHQGGSGLGLAICQRLIRLMGGEITITSQVGIGTTVGFYLPVGIIPENGSAEINSDFSQSGLTGLIECSEQQFMEITPSIDWNSLRSQLGHLPSPWLQELYRLAMRGSDDKILLLVNPVTHEYPELSSWLIQMAQNYDFDGILNLVQPLVNNT